MISTFVMLPSNDFYVLDYFSHFSRCWGTRQKKTVLLKNYHLFYRVLDQHHFIETNQERFKSPREKIKMKVKFIAWTPLVKQNKM
jgi:hypothetical protein